MRPTLLLAAALVALPVAARAQVPPAAASAIAATVLAPEVGQPAPNFSLSVADTAGTRAEPVSLEALRGKVVVLAFYPKDRTSGCTAELTKFRDEYATMFGKDVVVLPVSVDSLPTHTSWAREMNFPFALGSDPELALAAKYGSKVEGRPFASRTVFVIGKDGRVTYRDMKFNALSEAAYTTLAKAVAAAR